MSCIMNCGIRLFQPKNVNHSWRGEMAEETLVPAPGDGAPSSWRAVSVMILTWFYGAIPNHRVTQRKLESGIVYISD